MMPEQPRPGLYRHYKGQRYRVLHLARHTETEEWLVVYEQLYGDHSIWVRPRQMFIENVATPAGNRPRFEWIGE